MSGAAVPCEMCEHAGRRDAGDDPFAITRLSTGYVTLAATQHFRGYTFFVAKTCVPEIFLLPPDERASRIFMQRGTPPDERSDESRRMILRELRAADVTIEREYLDA